MKQVKRFVSLNIYYIIYFILFFTSYGFFFFFPEIDINFSKLFFDSSLNKFTYLNNEYFEFFSDFVFWLINIIITLLFITFVYRFYTKQKIGEIIYLFTVLIFDWYSIAHHLIKNIFGRARPFKTNIFNGPDSFSKPFEIANQCIKDCSFVSGHASLGFGLYALIFITNNRKKQVLFFLLGTITGLLFGAIRVIMGRHFLSDVWFAGFLMMFLCYFTYIIFYKLKILKE